MSRTMIATRPEEISWGCRSFSTPSYTENRPPTLNRTIPTRNPAM
jgi:hypothetical protein